MAKINYNILKFYSIWAITSLFPIIGLTVNLVINALEITTATQFISFLISLFVILFGNQICAGAFISVFGYLLLDQLYDYIKDKNFKYLYKYDSLNNYALLIFSSLILQESSGLLILVPLTSHANNYIVLANTLLIGACYLSGFYPLHIIILSTLVYFAINILKVIYNPNTTIKLMDMLYQSNYFKRAIKNKITMQNSDYLVVSDILIDPNPNVNQKPPTPIVQPDVKNNVPEQISAAIVNDVDVQLSPNKQEIKEIEDNIQIDNIYIDVNKDEKADILNITAQLEKAANLAMDDSTSRRQSTINIVDDYFIGSHFLSKN